MNYGPHSCSVARFRAPWKTVSLKRFREEVVLNSLVRNVPARARRWQEGVEGRWQELIHRSPWPDLTTARGD